MEKTINKTTLKLFFAEKQVIESPFVNRPMYYKRE
jgi:hypothetical protein